MRRLGSIACLALALAPGVARAQYVNPYTHNNWNNPVSASIDTMLYFNRQRMMLEHSLNYNRLRQDLRQKNQQRGQPKSQPQTQSPPRSQPQDALRRQRITEAGQLVVKQGRATTRFASAPFQTDVWITRWQPRTPAERLRLAQECRAQVDLWNREARLRGANLDDIGDTVALGFVLAYRVHAGGHEAPAGAFRSAAAAQRESYLKDPYFQGMPLEDKRYLQDTIFLESTDIVRESLTIVPGDLAGQARVRKRAGEFLSKYWSGPVEKLRAAPDRFVSLP